MKRTRLARRTPLLFAALLLLATGCSHPPESGYVSSRTFTPAYYDDWTDHTCVAYDKYGGCTVSVPVHHHDYVPDAWTLCLKRDDGDTKHDKTGCWTVDQDAYNRYPVGSHYPDAR